MTHLSAAELKAWYEEGKAADRGRVIGHLAECEACRKALSGYAIAAEPEIAAPIVSVADAVPRGYAAHKSGSPKSLAWLRPMYGLAAAAVIVFAVLWVTSFRQKPDDGAVRSAELTGVSPAGSTNATEFKFSSPFPAASYRVTARDAAGVVVFTATTTAASVALDQSERGRLVAGESYSWTVVALDRSGEPIAESKPVSFRYQP